MNKIFVLITLLLLSAGLFAQATLSDGARLLFINTKNRLTIAEKNSMYEATGFSLSKDKKQFAIADDAASLEYPFDVTVYPTDLNKDGKEEIFLVFGNSYTSGTTGSNVLLFIKDKSGKYQSNFGFSGTLPDIIPGPNTGYPDLLIGGPGFEFPIWKWNGKEYKFSRKISEKNLAKLKVVSVADASKLYVATIK